MGNWDVCVPASPRSVQFGGILDQVGREIGGRNVGLKGETDVKYFKKVEDISK